MITTSVKRRNFLTIGVGTSDASLPVRTQLEMENDSAKLKIMQERWRRRNIKRYARLAKKELPLGRRYA
jgi:hypothetical protein